MRVTNRTAYQKGFELGRSYLRKGTGTPIHELVKALRDFSSREEEADALKGYTTAITRNGSNGHYPTQSSKDERPAA